MTGSTPPGPPSASVVGNALTSFPEGMDATHVTALRNAIGFCQLQATRNQGTDPVRDPDGYYQAVTTMLRRFGLNNGGMSWSDFRLPAGTVAIDQVVAQILGEALTRPQLDVALATLNALKASADENGAPWRIFTDHARRDRNSVFGLGAARRTEGPFGPEIAMELTAFRLHRDESDPRFLWASCPSTSLSVTYGRTTLAFNVDLWNTPGIGDPINRAMGGVSAGYIADLPPLRR